MRTNCPEQTLCAMNEVERRPRTNDPYHDKRTYHMAKLMDDKGNVSPVCADRPKALDLAKHQLWTLDWNAVTCKKCLKRRPKDTQNEEE